MANIKFSFILLLTIYLSHINFIYCDFTYGYETDDFTLAIINLTYTDPVTGVVHSECEEYGKYSIGRIGSVSGKIVHVSSKRGTTHDACDPIDIDIFPSEQWVALAQYGNCRDSVKLKNIGNTNASAAIIYNNKAGTRLIKMHHKESSSKSYYEYQEVSISGLEIWHFASNIISVFISKEKGETVAAMVDNGTRVMVQISIGTHSAMRYANINRTSVLFVSISFIVLMIISLAWLIFYYVQRFRYIHAKDILARRLSSAAKKAMDKIPTKTIRPSDLESIFEGDLAELCPVCIDGFKTCDIVRILPCKHLFHKSCVDPWLLENRSCPMCKMDILKYYGLVFAGSQESILNIDVDLDMNQHYWHRGRHRSSSGGEIEVVHIPISSPMSRSNRRNRHRDRTSRTTTNNTQIQSHSSSSPSTPASIREPLQSNDNNINEDQDDGHETSSKSIDGPNLLQSVIKISPSFDEVNNDCEPLSSDMNDAQNEIKTNDDSGNYDHLCGDKY